MRSVPQALAPLVLYRQWVLWAAVPSRTRPGKVDKITIDPTTGRAADAHSPAIWLDAETAIAQAAARQCGVGFVFTEADPFWFLDIDNCLQTDGQWSPLSVQLCQQFAGAAVEVSQSGKGLHLFGTGAVPPHGCRNQANGLELYHTGRFVAFGGRDDVQGSAATDHTAALAWLVDNYFPPSAASQATPAEWTDGPVAEWRGPTDDDELIRHMLKSASAGAVFGGRATLAQLWNADAESLSRAFPPTGAGDFDHSAADAALCSHLAFWTGKDCERIDRLFRQSALYRDKWERSDYRTNTVLGAASICKNVYGSRLAAAERIVPPPPTTSTAEAVMREGYQFLGAHQQIDRFRGCVYVRSRHEVFTPDGDMLGPGQFKAAYGGYTFTMDDENKRVTRNAWEAFTESQVLTHPKVHEVCFRPELPPSAIVSEEGRTLVNTYVPAPVRRVMGDPSPFFDHMARMLPDANDRAALLAYLAACVQYIGVKFQWAPLIQGTEGNGKTIFIEVVAAAIGHRYTHRLNAADLKKNALTFNGWLERKLLVGIEEIYLPDRREIIEDLKEYITASRKEIQPKTVNQYMGDNRANFIFCSNHKDAIPIGLNGRRYAIFYTAQQSYNDILASGMGGEYFPNLYAWLRADGFAIVADYLATYDIPDALNPATGAHRAPETTSTSEAVGLSLGGIEQEILEAIAQGRPGFAGGWISSMALDRLIAERRDDRRIPRNRRRDIVESLGFQLHPGLRDGRVNSALPTDCGKPRLYIKAGHVSANLTDPRIIAEAYVKAQEIAPAAAGPFTSASNIP